MDGVLVNLDESFEMFKQYHPDEHRLYEKIGLWRAYGVFRDAPPVSDAVESVFKLAESNKYDMYVATSTPMTHPEAATDKIYWLRRHFGKMFNRKIFMTHRKDLLIGDILIDDRLKNGAEQFPGDFIHFNSLKYPDWNSVLDYLL